MSICDGRGIGGGKRMELGSGGEEGRLGGKGFGELWRGVGELRKGIWEGREVGVWCGGVEERGIHIDGGRNAVSGRQERKEKKERERGRVGFER